jgi:hypothetical protein
LPDAYASTSVPVDKSQGEIRLILRRFGAGNFTMGEGDDWAGVEFVHQQMRVRIKATAAPYSLDAARSRKGSSHHKMLTEADWPEQEQKRIWRVLRWTLEARLVAVEEDLETFEQAFLPYIVDPATGQTVWEGVRELVESGVLLVGGPGMRALSPPRVS